MAAEAYYRLTNRLPVVNVTSGPGGTNAITGVYGAFVDSIGMLVISGQVKFETTVRSTGLPLRQYGDQELDIEELVRPVTKYCEMVTDPQTIRYHLEKAIYLAKRAARAQLAGHSAERAGCARSIPIRC
jgi:acetolactate synthase-1/2/3 large subunit